MYLMPKMKTYRKTERKTCPTCKKQNNNYNNYCVVCATDLRLKQSIFCQACFTKQSANNKHCFHCGVEPTPMGKQPVYCEPKTVKPRAAPDLNQEDELLASGSMATEQIIADKEPTETVESKTIETIDENEEYRFLLLNHTLSLTSLFSWHLPI